LNIITRGLGKVQSLVTRGYAGLVAVITRTIRDAGGWIKKRKEEIDGRIQTNLVKVTPMLRAKLRYLDVEVELIGVDSYVKRIEVVLQRQRSRKKDIEVTLRS